MVLTWTLYSDPMKSSKKVLQWSIHPTLLQIMLNMIVSYVLADLVSYHHRYVLHLVWLDQSFGADSFFVESRSQ